MLDSELMVLEACVHVGQRNKPSDPSLNCLCSFVDLEVSLLSLARLVNY